MNADPARRVLPVEQYHALFDTIDAGFCIIEMLFDGARAYDYRFLEVNAAYERQTGLRDAVGRTVRELVPELEDVWFDIYGRVATTREPTRFDNGSEAMGRWFEVHAFPVGEPERHLVGILFTDVTERRLSERALRESEERLEQALSAGGGIGTWDWDVPNDRVYADERFARLYGVDPDMARAGAAIGEFFLGIHPHDRPRVEAEIAEAMAKGSAFVSQYRLVQADGSIRWAAAQGQCRLGIDGRPQRFPGVTFDITQSKHYAIRQAALLTLGDQIRDLSDPSRIAACGAEVLAKTLDVSRAGYGIIDTLAETILIEEDWNAEGVRSIAGTLRFRDFGSYIDDLKRGDTAIVHDARTDPRTRDAAQALAAIQATSFVNMPIVEQGRFVALFFANHAEPRHWSEDDLGLMRDIAERVRLATERARAEAERARLTETLEEQVAERTRELMQAEEALRQSQKMEAVGQLTGGLAHDFNNLLTGIIGSLEMLSIRIAQGRMADVDRYSLAAQGAAKRAAALTHRLLAFSRRQTLDPKPTDINRLISGMEELVRRTVGPAIEVEAVTAAGLWPTLVDPNQLENALLNLCINARDAMPDGGRLTIETGNRWLDTRTARERDMEPGQYVSLCVSDTGTGMTPEVIAKAFDPFFTTKPLGVGTGLGLSMIYGFARQSGGQVRIYSEIGEGAMVCIYLPRHFGTAETVADMPDLTDAPRAAAGETVLVVDDEPTVRMLVIEVLEELGYAAIEAADGAAGLKILRSGQRIDLLVSDVGLPGGMNGRQMADAGREGRPDLKVLFITGYAENAVIGNGQLDAGMHVMTKPFAMEALAARIRELIERP
ncbi:signal transduction histidine kinase/PAS domain-containing protein [Sphingomonas sp. SORGH_AS802]|uniref:ATP-binding protein n=1 Tax=unclassified Sphingomonas TaxID=196159 RepID=UPI002855FDC4|nr:MULTISPECIES: ATP-binding protein [unclassified Sphingomonas]MDR6126296.1 signal transduction histidine kinase/PAS domain-containing protein [Sphingomonas sp. SORGH_AS_0438]MDR6135859.1 signal transduction histidine kinase/PAS domain-containing protein [Sphingomonas sp. SORGH_AS_0802]